MTNAQQTQEPTGSNTIVVACKLPNGLKLEIGRYGEEGYETHTLNGPQGKKGIIDESGYALTTLPVSFWNKWLEYSPKDERGKVIAEKPNKKLPALVNGLVFAHASRDHVEAFAIEHMTAKTGLEALDPNKLPAKLEKFKNE